MLLRPIHEIARETLVVWRKPYFAAVPYLRAMLHLGTVRDDYGYDTGREIVNYFLSNAKTFRGEEARRIKAELRAHLDRGAA